MDGRCSVCIPPIRKTLIFRTGIYPAEFFIGNSMKLLWHHREIHVIIIVVTLLLATGHTYTALSVGYSYIALTAVLDRLCK